MCVFRVYSSSMFRVEMEIEQMREEMPCNTAVTRSLAQSIQPCAKGIVSSTSHFARVGESAPLYPVHRRRACPESHLHSSDSDTTGPKGVCDAGC